MSGITEYKRDDSMDHLRVLEGLYEIKFPIEKEVLIDFFMGEVTKPIEKNSLFDFESFGALSFLNHEKIGILIESLISESLINVGESNFKSSKVLLISSKGKEKLFPKQFETSDEKEDYVEGSEGLKELANFVKDLNSDQKMAVLSNSKRILCIAGAGSGKTTVLTKRIEFLAKFKRIKGDKILAITFTRKAKEEMQKRLLSLGVRAVVETFNSFSEKILLKYGGKIYGKRTRLASFQDKMVAILKALESLGLDIKTVTEKYYDSNFQNGKDSYEIQKNFISDCFNIFENFRALDLNYKDFEKKYMKNNNGNSKVIFEIIKFIDGYFRAFGLRTYADQIKDTLRFFEINKKFIPQFEHILIDETQDVNKSQFELLKILNPESIFFVGDPRQSIFGWRGSDLKYIEEFDSIYSDSEIINLTKNYRSAQNIINFINASLKEFNLPHLSSHENKNGKIEILNFVSQNEEFQFVKNKILSSDKPRQEIFVLSRTNKQIYELSQILKNFNIKHVIKTENSNEYTPKEGEVTLSTIHSIKGLEANTVFIIGCTPSNFPLNYSEHPVIESSGFYDYDKENEEKRIFYVGLSRAKEELYLTYSGKKHTDFITEDMKKIISK